MIKIEVINKIGVKIDEYINNTGATKTWIAKQLGYKTRQSLDGAINSTNLTIKTIGLFSAFLNCKPEELYEIKVIKE